MQKTYGFLHIKKVVLTRWSNEQIRAMLIEQFDSFWRKDTGTPRSKLKDVQKAAQLPHAVIVSGLRRAGKSTLLAQLGAFRAPFYGYGV
jgi:predicted AAA+ superfamily ATPase